MDLLDTLRTTGAIRAFSPEPVADEVVVRILDTARFAPSGGNRQTWRVVVVKDGERRRRLRDLYLPGWYEYLAQGRAGLVPFAAVTDEEAERRALLEAPAVAAEAARGPGDFAEHLDEVPVLLLLLADLRVLAAVDKHGGRFPLVSGASIYPFAWSVLLAARAEGLGGVLTTMVLRREAEVRDLFEVPDHFGVAAVIALGHPRHQPTRLRRGPVEDFTTVDRFDGPPVGRNVER